VAVSGKEKIQRFERARLYGHIKAGKTEHGIQNIDYALNFFDGKIPEVPDTLPGIREEGGC
jgi:hypothetical protein